MVINNGIVISWIACGSNTTSGTKRTVTYPYTYKTLCILSQSHIQATDSTDLISVRAAYTYAYTLSTLTRWMFNGTYMFIIIGF